MLKKTLLALASLIFISFALTGINILQKGGDHDGRSIEQLLGRHADQAIVKDVLQLSKPEIMQLFYAAPAPDLSSLKGEYKAKTLPVGIMAPAADFFTHHFFGPGHWEGKAFLPLAKNKGWGYNLFSVSDQTGRQHTARERRMDTFIGKSEIDDKDSFHLLYEAYNAGMIHSMHDEIRKINDTLYICMGYMAAGGGSINPAPFILYGKPSDWVGPDKE
jgi:hypothetical protein